MIITERHWRHPFDWIFDFDDVETVHHENDNIVILESSNNKFLVIDQEQNKAVRVNNLGLAKEAKRDRERMKKENEKKISSN